jgi:hypothetical protein
MANKLHWLYEIEHARGILRYMTIQYKNNDQTVPRVVAELKALQKVKTSAHRLPDLQRPALKM